MNRFRRLSFGLLVGVFGLATQPTPTLAQSGLYCVNLQGREILAQAVRDYIKDSLLAFAADTPDARLKLDEFEITDSRQTLRSGNYIACQVFIKATIKRGYVSRVVPFDLPVAAGYDQRGKLHLRLFERQGAIVRPFKIEGI